MFDKTLKMKKKQLSLNSFFGVEYNIKQKNEIFLKYDKHL